MRRLLMLLTIVMGTALIANARAVNVKSIEIKGHVLGETAAAFVSTEPRTRRQAQECRRDPGLPDCGRLMMALESGQRTEISTSGSSHFTFDGGRLVGMAVLVNGTADTMAADLEKKWGPESRHSVIHATGAFNAKWENHLLVWETRDGCVTLYEDNDPALQDRRPLLIIESRAHAPQYTVSVKELAAGQSRR